MEECEGCVKSEQEIYSYDADKASCICQCRYEFQTRKEFKSLNYFRCVLNCNQMKIQMRTLLTMFCNVVLYF